MTEDNDNDGFAAPTASCSGGFPKTDCRDGDARVHPEQLEYFSDGYCTRVLSGGTACIERSWDFNCDGVNTPLPSGSCSSSGGLGCSLSPCRLRAGPSGDPGASLCGVSVPHVDACRCDSLTNRCSARTADQLLRCR